MLRRLWTKKNIELLKSYVRTGNFFYFIILILMNGWDKTSLELTRIAIQNKNKKKIARQFKKKLLREPIKTDDSIIEYTNKVWVCWFQGIENSPEIVKLCYKSIKKYSNREVILITDMNYEKYTDLPEIILNKYNKGLISKTHFSDILRVELLSRHGGTWIDATVLLSEPLSDFFYEDFFFFQKCKPGKDGNGIYISSWFLSAKPNNMILLKTRELIFEYWEKNSRLQDYFLFHIFFCLSCEEYLELYNSVAKFDSSAPHYLQLKNSENFSKTQYELILQRTGIHKLTYKVEENVKNDKTNFYNHLLTEKNDKVHIIV